MSIFDIFFQKGGKFLRLMEDVAEEIHLTFEDFESFMEAPSTSRHIELLKIHEINEKQLASRLENALTKTYLTELEREDIMIITETMIRIPKAVSVLAQYVIAAGIHAQPLNLSKQLVYMGNSSEVLVSMIQELKAPHSMQRMRNLFRKMTRYEDRSEEDRTQLHLELYSGKYQPIQALALSNLYSLCGQIMERFHSASLFIMFTALKSN